MPTVQPEGGTVSNDQDRKDKRCCLHRVHDESQERNRERGGDGKSALSDADYQRRNDKPWQEFRHLVRSSGLQRTAKQFNVVSDLAVLLLQLLDLANAVHDRGVVAPAEPAADLG